MLSKLNFGITELQLVTNHRLTSGSDLEYIDAEEQFLPRKLDVLKAWHNYLDSLVEQKNINAM